MISRRLLRIKTLKLLFCHAGSGELHMDVIDKELLQSINKAYDLYYLILSSVGSLLAYAEERIDIAQHKFRPTYEEANPNRKFVDNKLVHLIANSRALTKHCETGHLSWNGDNESIIRHIYQNMIGRDYYKKYMSSDTQSFEEDRQFLKNFFSHEFESNQPLEAMLEEQCVWWTVDDLNYTLGSILRTLDAVEIEHFDKALFDRAKRSIGDEEFAKRLLRHALIHYSEYWDRAVMQFVKNWEADRVAAMDIALIVQGFSEAVEFPEIPIKVTINEYVEMAKYYSTHNSHVFVNGILDKMIKAGIDEGIIKKKNLGLVESAPPRRKN